MFWGYVRTLLIRVSSCTISYCQSISLLVVSLFTLAVALSLAEIASKYPTSGGAYYWTYQLSPRRYRLLLSYITGWLIVTGDWMLALSAAFVSGLSRLSKYECADLAQGTAQFFVAEVGIYHPEWEATAWQTCARDFLSVSSSPLTSTPAQTSSSSVSCSSSPYSASSSTDTCRCSRCALSIHQHFKHPSPTTSLTLTIPDHLRLLDRPRARG